jgi:integrase
MECVRLRIKDVDFDRKRIYVLGKGDKWRGTILSETIIFELQNHLDRVTALHHRDLEEGFGKRKPISVCCKISWARPMLRPPSGIPM